MGASHELTNRITRKEPKYHPACLPLPRLRATRILRELMGTSERTANTEPIVADGDDLILNDHIDGVPRNSGSCQKIERFTGSEAAKVALVISPQTSTGAI